jgi:hypothetical protein
MAQVTTLHTAPPCSLSRALLSVCVRLVCSRVLPAALCPAPVPVHPLFCQNLLAFLGWSFALPATDIVAELPPSQRAPRCGALEFFVAVAIFNALFSLCAFAASQLQVCALCLTAHAVPTFLPLGASCVSSLPRRCLVIAGHNERGF